jgi:hypothetical protein
MELASSLISVANRNFHALALGGRVKSVFANLVNEHFL